MRKLYWPQFLFWAALCCLVPKVYAQSCGPYSPSADGRVMWTVPPLPDYATSDPDLSTQYITWLCDTGFRWERNAEVGTKREMLVWIASRAATPAQWGALLTDRYRDTATTRANRAAMPCRGMPLHQPYNAAAISASCARYVPYLDDMIRMLEITERSLPPIVWKVAPRSDACSVNGVSVRPCPTRPTFALNVNGTRGSQVGSITTGTECKCIARVIAEPISGTRYSNYYCEVTPDRVALCERQTQ